MHHAAFNGKSRHVMRHKQRRGRQPKPVSHCKKRTFTNKDNGLETCRWYAGSPHLLLSSPCSSSTPSRCVDWRLFSLSQGRLVMIYYLSTLAADSANPKEQASFTFFFQPQQKGECRDILNCIAKDPSSFPPAFLQIFGGKPSSSDSES
jgi:hypothetical protein